MVDGQMTYGDYAKYADIAGWVMLFFSVSMVLSIFAAPLEPINLREYLTPLLMFVATLSFFLRMTFKDRANEILAKMARQRQEEALNETLRRQQEMWDAMSRMHPHERFAGDLVRNPDGSYSPAGRNGARMLH